MKEIMFDRQSIDWLTALWHISAKNIVRQGIINVIKKSKYNYKSIVDWPPHGT